MPHNGAGASPATQPDLGANQEGATHRHDAYLSVRIVSREARKLADDQNLQISGSRLRKLVRRFIEDGRTDVDLRTWFLTYADPVGETAVRNVMRGDGQ